MKDFHKKAQRNVNKFKGLYAYFQLLLKFLRLKNKQRCKNNTFFTILHFFCVRVVIEKL